jgi:hypothetical protein
MTDYGIYIIEFLRPEDYLDGYILHEILKLSLIPTEYKWVGNKEELIETLEDFDKTKFRYLHISCHADETGFEINGGEITNAEIQELTANILDNKRLFLSACKGANRDLASRIISNNRANSLLGIPIKLHFDKSVLFWSSFYHLINEVDATSMKREQIIDIVKKCVNLFNIPVNYYSKIKNSSTYMRRLKIRASHIDNRRIKVKA